MGQPIPYGKINDPLNGKRRKGSVPAHRLAVPTNDLLMILFFLMLLVVAMHSFYLHRSDRPSLTGKKSDREWINGHLDHLLSASAVAATPVRSSSVPATSPAPAFREYAAVLAQHVNDRGLVDYKELQANRARLDRFIASLAAGASPASTASPIALCSPSTSRNRPGGDINRRRARSR